MILRANKVEMVLLILCIWILACEMAKAQERPGHNTDAVRLQTQVGHTDNLSSATFSPDGRMVLTASHDSTACLWDTATGWELRRFIGHTDAVTSAAFAPNGRTVVTSSKDRTARLWDTATGQEVRRLEGHTSWVGFSVFSPDGRFVLTGGWDATLRLWNTSTGQELRRFTGFTNSVTAVFAPDGRTILTMSQAQPARLWNVTTGQELRRFAGHVPFGVTSAVFSPDGRQVLTGSGDGTTYVWDTATGRELRRFTGDTGTVTSAVLAPDGQTILTVTQSTIRLSDVETGRERRRFTYENFLLTSAVFGPDGLTILTARGTTARLWDLRTWEEVRRFEGYALSMTSPVFSPDGRTILTASHEGTARLWDTTTGAEVRTFEGHTSWIYSAGFSPDGRFILTGSGDTTARLWDTSTGKELRRIQGPNGQPLSSVAFSPDGKFVLAKCSGRHVCLWDVTTWQELRRFEDDTLIHHPSNEISLAVFSPDGRTILGRSLLGGLLLLETRTGQELRRFKGCSNTVTSIAFSPDGRFVVAAAGWEGTACLWDTATGEELRRFDGHTGMVTSAVISPDSRWVLTASHDGTARLWDAANGRELHRLGHTGYVESAAFSPDGQFVLTAGNDHTIRRWDVQTGTELVRLVSFTDGTWVVSTPDGRFDTNNLEEIKGLHWIMPDDPFRALPLEIFMRDYYEPRLLPRVLAKEKLPAIRSLAELNRAQPMIKFKTIEVEDAPAGLVAVTVEIASNNVKILREGKSVAMGSGAYDLRLFRNGQLVGQFPDPQDKQLSGDQTRDQAIAQWRKQHAITLDPKMGKQTITFRGIKLPRTVGLQNVEFSAYAFNVDRVKSTTARSILPIPKTLTPRQGRAYVVTIGANRFAGNRMPSLSFAVNDAKVLNEELSRRLKAIHDPATGKLLFSEANVVPISLITDSIDDDRSKSRHINHATKGRIKAVIDKLAGKPVDLAQLEGIANADQLQLAQPEDLVLISFSTHGDTDGNKQFYLMPSDLGESSDENDLWRHAISSEELSAWLRPVDAGELVMIVDACRSAATVKNQEFKPGPMGSRGLGQLAFDKGMRILAASQLDQEAEEGLETELGLLTSALVVHGLQNHRADFKPPDGTIRLAEWLQYSVEQVPKLYTKFHSKDPHGVIPSATRMGTPLDKPKGNVESIQTPELFDYARGRDLPLINGVGQQDR